MKEKWIRNSLFTVFLLCVGLTAFFPSSIPVQILLIAAVGVSLIFIDYYAPILVKLSPDNPKVKTLRRVLRVSLAVMLAVTMGIWLFPEQFTRLVGEGGVWQTLLIAAGILVFGNIAPKLPCNGYVGIRLPWTVSNEKAWRACHRLLGYLSFFTAPLLILGRLIFPIPYCLPVCLAVWLAVPMIYSLWIYYRDKTRGVSYLPIGKRIYYLFPSLLSAVINITAYFYLPPTLAMQIQRGGSPGGLMSTPAGLLIMFGTVLAVNLFSLFSQKKEKGYFALSVFLLLGNGLILYYNLAVL